MLSAGVGEQKAVGLFSERAEVRSGWIALEGKGGCGDGGVGVGTTS